MLNPCKNMNDVLNRLATKLYVTVSEYYKNNGQTLAILGGLGLLVAGTADLSVAQAAGPVAPDSYFIAGLCRVLSLPEGAFGALVMTVAGLTAVVGAAMGMYKLSLNCIVVAVGCYAVRPVMQLFFNITDAQCPGPFSAPAPGG